MKDLTELFALMIVFRTMWLGWDYYTIEDNEKRADAIMKSMFFVFVAGLILAILVIAQ